MATQLGRYEIREELGRGGMATVYLGYDPQFKRTVAVKVLPPQFTHDPDFFARFEQEAETIAQLEHTAIVPVYDYGRNGDLPYFVMRLMAGGDLRAAIRQGALPPARVAAISQRIGAALDKAHNRGIVHRDIKPSNILFDDDEYAYLSDFGIVRLTELTRTVTMIGTPEYMTPEQIRGEGVDGRSDVYQLGVVIYEMLTGRQPFTGENTAALLYKHAHEPAPPLQNLNASLPPACEDVIQQALAKNPADRFATASSLADALAEALSTPQPVKRTAVTPPPREQRDAAQVYRLTPKQAAPEPETVRPAARPQREPQAAAVPPAQKPNGTAVARRQLLHDQDWRWLALWVIANGLGWTLATLLAQQVSAIFPHSYYLIVIGLIVALGMPWFTAQWLALRSYVPLSSRWIWYSTAAFGLTVGYSLLVGLFGPIWFDLATGALIGAAQWLLLRRHLQAAAGWIPAVMLAMFLNRLLTNAWGTLFGDTYWGYGASLGGWTILLNLLNGALWGAVTGWALVLLVSLTREMKRKNG